MNYEKYIKNTLAFMLIADLWECSKEYLDPVPQTSLSELSVFDTKERVVGQVNGMYAFMKVGAILADRFYVYDDMRAIISCLKVPTL